MRRTITALVLAIFMLSATGCLVMAGSEIEESGTQITHETLTKLEPGVTTEAWLVATLGEPTRRTVVEGQEHIHVLRYDHVVTKHEGGAVFLIFAGGSSKTKVTRTYIETIDGLVSRYWTEP
jgi:hypothetical protein